MPQYKIEIVSPACTDFIIYEKANNTDSKKVKGKVRLKPTRIQWKGPNQQEWRSVHMDKFIAWITGEHAGAVLTKK